MLTPTEKRSLLSACRKLEEGPDYRCNDYVENLLTTALDFQMRVETVNAALDHCRTTNKLRTHDALAKIVRKYPKTKDGHLALANHLWDNNHWTRAEFLRELIERFEERGVRDQQSLTKWAEEADFNRDVKGKFKVGTHSIGYTLFQWLRLRVGVTTVKPDAHVQRFVAAAIGREATPTEIVPALLEVAEELGTPPNRLDAAIWHYQREQ